MPLQIKATNWPPTGEIDTYNDDLVVAITEIIVGKPDPDRKSSIFGEKFIGLNPKQLDRKTAEKRMVPSSSCPRKTH